MPFKKSKKHQQPLTDAAFDAEYAALDAALDTRAAQPAVPVTPAQPEPAAPAPVDVQPTEPEPTEEPAAAQPMTPPPAEAPAAAPEEAAPTEPAPAPDTPAPLPEPSAEEPAPAPADPEPAAEPADEPATETPVPEASAPETPAPESPAPEKDSKEAASEKKRKKKKKKEPIAEEIQENQEPEESEETGKKKKKKTKKDRKKKKKFKKPKRKGRFITPLILLGTLVVLAIGCFWNIMYCQNNFEINFYQIESIHVSSNVRIAVISDVHLKEYGEDNKELVDAVRAVDPDIIISAGDLVTYGVADYDNMLSLCRQLSEIAPLYGVMGNHEDEKTYLEHDAELRQRFRDAGMVTLVNQTITIKVRNDEIELVGISGGTEGFDLYGGKEEMEKLGEHNAKLRICIAHVPTLFKDRLEDYDFDVGIAGHTHGGLIRLPMIGGLYSAEEGFRPTYDGGVYTLENGAQLFVSRGLGNSGKIPRFNNTPELAVIDIRWY